MEVQSYDQLIEKWKPVLDEESAGEIKDNHRRSVTAALLENQEKAIAEQNETMLFEAHLLTILQVCPILTQS